MMVWDSRMERSTRHRDLHGCTARSIVIDSLAAEDCDCEELARVMHESIHGLASADYSTEQLRAWSPAPRNREAAGERFAGQRVWRASDSQGVVGFMTLARESYIDFAYVLPRVTGSGVAHALYEAVERHARKAETPELTSDVSLTARPFFERQGFEVVAEQRKQRDGVALTNFRVRKRLCS